MSKTDERLNRGEDIAIVGMSVTVPGAQSLEAFWHNLRGGISGITRLDEDALRAAGESPEKMRRKNYVPAAALLEGFDTFDPEFFGFSPKDAAILDPQHRKFLEVAWEAMEQAGHPPETIPGPIGVFAGCGMGSYFYFNICSNPDLVDDVGMFLLRHTGNDKDFLSTRVSHVFDLRGPSINMQTACSTSLVAVHYAARALQSGEVDMALAGGVTIELPQGRGYLFQENEILSPDGECHAFDHRAQGTVFGSGAGAVALRRLSDAIADGDHIWAVIKGSAVNNDGAAKAGYLAPSVDGQSAAVRRALADADVPAESIGYVECHGTGTYLGDPIEVAALTDAYRSQTQARDFCRIGSVKTNIGHLDTAAGVAGLVKTALSLHHREIPPSLGYEAPNPAIDFDSSPFSVNATLYDWPAGATPRRAAVNALGVGGTNAHAVLEEAPARDASDEADFPFHVLCLSGRSKAALDANAKALAAHLRAHPDLPLADVAFTLKNGRRGFEKRRVLVAETALEASDLLETGASRRVFTHDVVGARPEVVFMFPGGGAQYPDMARDLYETEPVFAEWMDRGLDHLQPQLDYDIRALWLPEVGAAEAAAQRLQTPSVQLPLIMIVEYALAQLWLSWGVKPAALVGHSMGENTAACLAGVMSFEDCIDLVLLRGQLFDTVAPGGMLSVALSRDAIEPLLGDDLDIASVNGPELTAVSGPQAALDRLARDLAARDVDCQRIQIDIAAHSRMLEPILARYQSFLQGLSLAAPTLQVLSNRTGAVMTAAQATDPEYWVQQLRRTVLFADCITTLAQGPARVYLEVGPGKALSALARMNPGVKPGQVISSLRHPDQKIADDAYFLGVIGRLWATGVEADWAQIWGEAKRHRLPLPTYAFQRSRYFIEPGVATIQAAAPAMERYEEIADWGWRPVWRPRLAECEIDPQSDLATTAPQRWLIFEDDVGVGARLGDRLREAGHQVIRVRPGDAFLRLGDDTYALTPEAGRGGYEALMQALTERDCLPTRVVHLWLLTGKENYRPGSSFFERNLDQGFYSLMHLGRVLGEAGLADPLHMTVVTTGAAQLKDEALPYPEKAMIAGPAGVLPRELPGVTCATLDIEMPATPGQQAGVVRSLLTRKAGRDDAEAPLAALVDRLLEDLFATPANTVAAYRGLKRFEQRFSQARLPQASDTYRDGGTYLITGGFGGIGLSIAEDLATRHKANIVLLSRHGLPPREAWDTQTGAIARRIAKVRRIEALGGKVMVQEADVADVAQMRAAVADITAKFGPVHGVFHAAGVIDDGPLLAKTEVGVAAVIAPKVQGLTVLEKIFPDGSLDLLVLFSSTSTATRPAGQLDYVAANAFLNAYAQSKAGGKTRVFAVNWGIWAEVGMAANAVARPGADWTQDAGPLARPQPLLDTVAEDNAGRTVLMAQMGTDSHWVLDQHRTKDGQALMPGTGMIEMIAQALRAQGVTGGFVLRDLYFLRPLQVTDAARDLRVVLDPMAEGYDIEIRSACEAGGRTGYQLNAQAQVVMQDASTVERIDPAAIAARCLETAQADPSGRLRAAQEAHLDFGPRWHVLRETALGKGEGLARLSLPPEARGDIDAGYLLHPGLMDIATGWAMGLIDGYKAAHLWVPVVYRSLRVRGPLPAEIISWVRLSGDSNTDAGSAVFDVTLADASGNILVEIEGFAIQRLEAGFAKPGPVDPRELTFDEAATDGAAPSADEERLAHAVSQGITPAEGPQALARALAAGRAQMIVSSLPLDALMAQANQRVGGRKPAGQTFDRPELDGDFVAPRTEIEKTLAEIWQNLLGVSGIGIEDSFFDLGGHSLIAVRLFATIKRTWGVHFPISVLFEAPTIEKCAALIAAEVGEVPQEGTVAAAPATTRSYDHLVTLHKGPGQAARAPLFIVAGMFGNVLNLRHLALALGQGRAVYGLQARGLISDMEPHVTIEDAAADYIAEIRSVQPEGPYLLSGYSGGGITAVEMARQLRADGQDVPLVAMLDTPLPVRPPLNAQDKVLIKLHELRRKGLRYFGEWARARLAWELRKLRGEVDLGDLQAVPGAEFNNRKIEAAFREAVSRYELQPSDAPLTLFRPPIDRHWAVSRGRFVSAEREYVSDDNDWTRFAPNLEVIEVAGDHMNMVLPPSVSVLGKMLGKVIGRVERAYATPQGTDGEQASWSSSTAAE